MARGDRTQLVQKLAGRFAGVSTSDADDLLEAAGSSAQVPDGWSLKSSSIQRSLAIGILSAETSGVIDRLALMLGADGPSGLRDTAVPTESPPPAPPSDEAPDGPIFVVHGHDHLALHQTVRVVEAATDRKAVVLHEQVNSGQTILEKFERHALEASYAVVLLTADDEGGKVSAVDRRPRGRQNVVFELGFFFGKLGRNRVAVLIDPQVEEPSDIEGLVYVPLDSSGAWKHALAKELASAGIAVDHASIP